MLLTTLAARTVFNSSNAGIPCSNSAPEMESMSASFCDDLSCVGTGFAMGRSLTKIRAKSLNDPLSQN
jgi:hypothetical protein